MLVSHVGELDNLHLVGLVDPVRFAPRLLFLGFGPDGDVVGDGGASVGRRSSTLSMALKKGKNKNCQC